jgi:hypothetical protein
MSVAGRLSALAGSVFVFANAVSPGLAQDRFNARWLAGEFCMADKAKWKFVDDSHNQVTAHAADGGVTVWFVEFPSNQQFTLTRLHGDANIARMTFAVVEGGPAAKAFRVVEPSDAGVNKGEWRNPCR